VIGGWHRRRLGRYQLRALSGEATHAAVDAAIQRDEKPLRLLFEEHFDSLGIMGVVEQRDVLADEAHGGLEEFAIQSDAAVLVDFAPHEFEFLREQRAHRRLGFASETVTQWLEQAGLEPVLYRNLPPEQGSEGKIAVSLWLGRDRRVALAASAREVA